MTVRKYDILLSENLNIDESSGINKFTFFHPKLTFENATSDCLGDPKEETDGERSSGTHIFQGFFFVFFLDFFSRLGIRYLCWLLVASGSFC